MRLLNAKTFALEEYMGDTVPKYAILSHTWNEEEVLFTDILHDLPNARKKHGFRKIEYCAVQTLEDGFSHCWIDTCCIDKSSSAELTESINSMFVWYSQAERCYAYLEDVILDDPSPEIAERANPFASQDDSSYQLEELNIIWKDEVGKSRWFTRGWTLQELIAPRHLIFYSHNWYALGNKRQRSYELSDITRIDGDILRMGGFRTASVAQRMSWASLRNTTRIEDQAYCLIGIFNVNMPLLYGEGEKAFMRLQEEIIKNSDDQSIFAWTTESSSRASIHGLLAKSPKYFKNSREMMFSPLEQGEPYSITNRGLRISLPCSKLSTTGTSEFLGRLNCTTEGNRSVAIRLIRLSTYNETDQFARTDLRSILEVDRDTSKSFPKSQLLYVRNTIHLLPGFTTNWIAGFTLDLHRSASLSYTVWPESNWSLEHMFCRFPLGLTDYTIDSIGSTIFTARVVWYWDQPLASDFTGMTKSGFKFESNLGPSTKFGRKTKFLFEFQINLGSSTEATGLATLFGYKIMPPHSFWGFSCEVRPTYDISRTPTHEEICHNKMKRSSWGRPNGLDLDIMDDEVVVVATQSLKNEPLRFVWHYGMP